MPNRTQIRGLIVRAYLKSRYLISLRLQEGSQFVFDVAKTGTKRSYRVTIQFARFSIFPGCANRYTALDCTCPRYQMTKEICHHCLLVFDFHAESINEPLAAEHFGNYELSKASKTQLLKALAA